MMKTIDTNQQVGMVCSQQQSKQILVLILFVLVSVSMTSPSNAFVHTLQHQPNPIQQQRQQKQQQYRHYSAFSTNVVLERNNKFYSISNKQAARPISMSLSDDNNNNEIDQGGSTTISSSSSSSKTVVDNDSNTNNQLINGQVTAVDVRQEADGALANVGWSMPMEGELTSTDPFVIAISQQIELESGVPLDGLLNPAKVVNLERELYVSRLQLASLTGVATSTETKLFLTTSECDGGGGGIEADNLRKLIQKKEASLLIERRSVFRGWLKNLFLFQAGISFLLSYVMATTPQVLFGQYDWYYSYNMDLSISVLGYWWWWLFIVPSLRSRRPSGNEKRALDISFIGTPLISILAPILFTKDTSLIWDANLLVVTTAYIFVYFISPEGSTNTDDDDDDSSTSNKTPSWLKFIYKSLDFGSGRERGARQ
jgi:hypothetical protein